MKRLTLAALLLAVLVILAPPAEAVDNNFFNWNTFSQFDRRDLGLAMGSGVCRG